MIIANIDEPSFGHTTSLPPDYVERVYAGVLGKLIGVYLGRPFEGWTHQRIMKELGNIEYYVHDRLGVDCVVTDDDVSGTFAFVRAIEEHGVNGISSRAIGKTWLNTVVEKKSVFWWGGRGISTEHTAYLNLKQGVPAPESGSIERNGKTIAEQIGAQIFIDGWAMVSPGRPAVAARLAEGAGKVSHDGESVYAAMLWAAMEAEAFVSKDVDHLLDLGLGFIPSDSLIARAIGEVREWCKEDQDWLKTRQRIEDKYGYDKFHGHCHVVPNHCIMVMSLLYAGDNFTRAMQVINTCGWDTDCNSGNVGCLVALMHGMDSFGDGPDWRGPVNDRALISSADNGYSINNAARLTLDIVNMGRQLAGKAALLPPKDGAQFHFTLPGSTQGFAAAEKGVSVHQGINQGIPALCVELAQPEVTVTTQTSAPLNLLKMLPVYPLSSSPLVYTGQRVYAVVSPGNLPAPVQVRFCLSYVDSSNSLVLIKSDQSITLEPSSGSKRLEWIVPEIPESQPIANIGLAFTGHKGGQVWLDRLGWDGAPNLTVARPQSKPQTFWDLQWVQSVSDWRAFGDTTIYIAQDAGEGIVSYGTREWKDYSVTVSDLCVRLGAPCGVAIRVQGLNRYYSVVLIEGHVAIVKALDDQRIELARAPFDWSLDSLYEVNISARGSAIRAKIGDVSLEARDDQYEGGAMGLVVTKGALSTGPIRIQPADS